MTTTTTKRPAAKKLTTYVVFRHGSNAANQGMRERMPVAFVEATSAEQAVARCDANCYVNQRLTAQPVSRAPRADIRELQESIAREN